MKLQFAISLLRLALVVDPLRMRPEGRKQDITLWREPRPNTAFPQSSAVVAWPARAQTKGRTGALIRKDGTRLTHTQTHTYSYLHAPISHLHLGSKVQELDDTMQLTFEYQESFACL